MRNLKKVLSVLLVVVIMATAMVPAFAAETYTYSTQAEALYKVGLFNGISTTDYVPDLGSALNREQGFKLILSLLGKADDAKALTAADADAALAAFGDAKDVEPSLKNYVAYAVKNGLVIGDTSKLLNAKGPMLGKDFATILLRQLGYADTEFAYDTATATLAEKGGLSTTEATKFGSKELIRDDAVGMMYAALQAKYKTGETVVAQLVASKDVDEAKAIAAGVYTKPATQAVTATVTGNKKFTVAFNTAIDPTKATVTVKKGSIAVNVASVAPSADNKSLVVTMASKLTAGDYTISVAGVSDAALSATVTAADEKVTSITFNSDKAPISRDAKSITVGYKVFNQYNEDVTTSFSVTVTASRGSYSASDSDGSIVITDTTDFVVDNKVSVQVLHVGTGTFASTVATAVTKAQVADVAINALVLKDSKDLDTSKTPSDYKLDVTFKDQYGNTVTDTTYLDNSLEDVTVTVNAPQYVSVAGGTTTAGVVQYPAFTYDSTAKKMYLPLSAPSGLTAGTAKVTIISNTTGKIATYDVVVKSSGKVDTLTLSAPDLAVVGEKVKIPFAAVDVYGNAMTDASKLNSGMTSISASAGSITFEQDYVAGTANLVLDLTKVDTAKTIVITGITSTSKLAQLSVDAKELRKPVVVSSYTSSFTPNLAIGGTSDLRTDRVVVKDQHGRDITTIPTFIKDGDGKITSETDVSIYTAYRVVATSASPAYTKLSVAAGNGGSLATVTSDTYYIDTVAKDSTNPVKFTGIAKGSSTVTLKLQKTDGTDVKNSEYVFTSNVVEKASIVSYELADIAPLFVSADSSAYKKAITVNGILADGTKVVVPASYYSLIAPDLNTSVAGNVYAKPVAAYTAITGSVTDTTVPVTIVVNATNGAVLLNKAVTVSTVAPAPKTLSLITSATTSGIIINPEGTSAISVAVGSIVDNATIDAIATAAIVNKNQYGVENTVDTYTSVIVTNLASGKSIKGENGATSTVLAAGDTFNVTAVTSNGVVFTFKVILK